MEKTTKEDNGTVLLKMAEEALKNYEQSLKTGLKLQKEATQWWTKSLQQTAPTADLRKWFAHDPARWKQFQTRYRNELRQKKDAIQSLKDEAKERTVTLVYAARDEAHNGALVLKRFLEGR